MKVYQDGKKRQAGINLFPIVTLEPFEMRTSEGHGGPSQNRKHSISKGSSVTSNWD
jgi:hypothetical protein